MYYQKIRKSRSSFLKHKNILHSNFFKYKSCLNNGKNSFKKLSRSKSLDSSLYYKPAGLSYLKHLSKYLKRCINLWSKDRIICSFGNYSENLKLNVEFVKDHLRNGTQSFGHYALKGKREPHINEIKYPNNCLFDVLASQSGIHPNTLRRAAIKEARKRSKRKFSKSRVLNSKRFPIVLDPNCINYAAIRGGARYNGKTKEKAKEILDASQKGESHPNRQRGHPRGHASYASATGDTDSVENYSKYGRKTGFLSRSDQDFVAHLMLKTSAVQDVLEVLNEKGKNADKEDVKIRGKDLPVDDDKLPKAQEWIRGARQGEPSRFRDVVLVMKHFYEKYNDETADVFVLTLYPRL